MRKQLLITAALSCFGLTAGCETSSRLMQDQNDPKQHLVIKDIDGRPVMKVDTVITKVMNPVGGNLIQIDVYKQVYVDANDPRVRGLSSSSAQSSSAGSLNLGAVLGSAVNATGEVMAAGRYKPARSNVNIGNTSAGSIDANAKAASDSDADAKADSNAAASTP